MIRRHQAKRWTGDLMTDPVVDRKLLSTAYFRGHERREGVRHAAFPSLLRCEPWGDAVNCAKGFRAKSTIAVSDRCSHSDSRTPDELIILNNGHSERLGTIEVSVWRGIFRSHKKDTTTNTKTVSTSNCPRYGTDLAGDAINVVQWQRVCDGMTRLLPSCPASRWHILYRLTGQGSLICLGVGA